MCRPQLCVRLTTALSTFADSATAVCATTKTRHLNRRGQLAEFEQESNTDSQQCVQTSTLRQAQHWAHARRTPTSAASATTPSAPYSATLTAAAAAPASAARATASPATLASSVNSPSAGMTPSAFDTAATRCVSKRGGRPTSLVALSETLKRRQRRACAGVRHGRRVHARPKRRAAAPSGHQPATHRRRQRR